MARRQRAAQAVRRVWPYVLMAWERWQALPDDKKDRYRRQAREYTTRGRKAIESRRGRGRKR